MSDRCLNCNERIELVECADGHDRWMHVIYGTTPKTTYRECRPPRTYAEPQIPPELHLT